MSKSEQFELVESIASYAGNLYNALDAIVSSLREDKLRDALTNFSQSIEGIEWFISAVTLYNKSLEEDAEQMDIQVFNSFLSEIIDAVENMDYVLFADLLEYEILPIIDDWGIRLDKILEEWE